MISELQWPLTADLPFLFKFFRSRAQLKEALNAVSVHAPQTVRRIPMPRTFTASRSTHLIAHVTAHLTALAMAFLVSSGTSCSTSKKSDRKLEDVTSAGFGNHPAFRKLMDDFTLKLYQLDPMWDFYNYSERPGPTLGNDLSPEVKKLQITLYEETLREYEKLKPELISNLDIESGILFDNYLKNQRMYHLNPWTGLVDVNHLENRLYSYAKMGAGIASFPFETKEDFENYIARARELKSWSSSFEALLLEAKSKKFRVGKNTIKLLKESWERLLTEKIEDSQFYQPVKAAEKLFGPAYAKGLHEKYVSSINSEIYPEIRNLIKSLDDYLPAAGSQFGIYKIDGSNSLYDLYRSQSTDQSTLTAHEIHQVGLKEVKRIQKEIDTVKNKIGHRKLSFEKFIKFLRESPNSSYKTEAELTAAFRDAETKVAAVVGNYFSNIPNVPLELRGIPDPKVPAGSYNGLSDTIKKAYFNYNSADLKSTTRYATHTLYVHEGVPGHHFQLSINYFLKAKLGKFRTELLFSVPYIEGWALYAEYLGREMGIYNTPELLLGTYNDEMMRAVRLVVDTGMHALGWSREKAVKYMHSNLTEDLSGVESEIDRYSVWPGQALGYKLGQIEILKLRRESEKKLGKKFDIKAFHKVVLESGSITIPLLQEKVRAWVAAEQAVRYPAFEP